VLLLLSWKMALESMLIKNYFHTRKKNCFSMTTRVRSRLAYLKMHIFLYVSDLSRSHRARGKEHTQI
jgi:hypothetical protein